MTNYMLMYACQIGCKQAVVEAMKEEREFSIYFAGGEISRGG